MDICRFWLEQFIGKVGGTYTIEGVCIGELFGVEDSEDSPALSVSPEADMSKEHTFVSSTKLIRFSMEVVSTLRKTFVLDARVSIWMSESSQSSVNLIRKSDEPDLLIAVSPFCIG